MGRQAEQCVKHTAIGGIETSNGIGPNLHDAILRVPGMVPALKSNYPKPKH